jgi:ComF family protein
MRILTRLLDRLKIYSCLFCQEPGEYVCDRCKNVFFEGYDEQVATDGHTFLDQVTVGFRYNKALEYSLEQAKHKGFYTIAYSLGKLLAEELLNRESKKDLLLADNLIIIPVPLFKNKQLKRGFNQVEIMFDGMCDYLKSKFGIKLNSVNLLKRVKNTQTQIGMNKSQREQNLRDVFRVDLNQIDDLSKKYTVVLLDDVYTTGTTLNECSRALKSCEELSIEKVVGIVFAKG